MSVISEDELPFDEWNDPPDDMALAAIAAAKPRKHRRHWYRIYIGACPVCGRDKGSRERVYGRKPRMGKRYVELSDAETFDHCI